MEEALSKLVEILFVAVGLAVCIVALLRTRKQVGGVPPPASSWGEVIATLFAAGCAAVGPHVLVIALTPGMPKMPILTGYALIPSGVLALVLLGVAYKYGWPRLSNRIATGIWAGAAATAALDVVRLTGFYLGLMPGNMPRMFGVLILNQMAGGPTVFSDLIGYLYHYWVGACFGLTLTLICGKTKWWAGLIWGLLIELGMMTTPPMVVAMDTGYFGLKFGIGLLIVSLIAHIVYGVFLGLLVEKYTIHRGSLFGLIVGNFSRVRR